MRWTCNLTSLGRGIALALLCALTLDLAATQMIPFSIPELAARAQLVLRGTVQSQTCQRDSTGRIFTRVELQVAETWKGPLATNRFTIVLGGGVLGEERATVGGQAEYRLGEEVVAFLVLNSRGEGVTLGLAQGKFTVWAETATGAKLARNPFHGAAVSVSPLALSSTNTPPARLTLADLKRQVQEATR